ncbi:MAG: hypothetical protein AB7N24_01425 [Dehalococcoidia bacterium]
MTRLKSLLKREILARDVGRVIGKPEDVLVDPESHKVSLIVLNYGELPETSVVLPADAVGIFDTDAMTIESLDQLHLAQHEKVLLSKMEAGLKLRSRSTFTNDGVRLGTLDGIDIDRTGNVEAYHIRKPRFGLLRPRTIVSPSEVGGLGEDVAVVKNEPQRAG